MTTTQLTQPTLDASDKVATIANATRQLLAGAQEIRDRTRLAVGEAARIGKQLVDEKEWVDTTYGRGHWEAYFEKHFGKVLAARTGRTWMKLAAIAHEIKSYDTNRIRKKIVAVAASKAEMRTLRIGMRALEIGIPPVCHDAGEESPTHAGADVRFEQVRTHLSLINQLIADIRRLQSQRPMPAKVQAVLRDYEPLLQAISTLREMA